MSTKLFFGVAFFISIHVFSQTEFETYGNGLIYNEATMAKLGKIVDSLNLKYKRCDINKVLYSKSQTIGHVISMDTADIKKAKEYMDNNISFEAFLIKCPQAVIKSNVVIVKDKYQDYNDVEIVEISEINLKDDYGIVIRQKNIDDFYNKELKNSWLYNYDEKTDYSRESIEAFYFSDSFKSVPLDLKYSKQIGYSDCLIDTTSSKFMKNTKAGWVELPKDWQKLKFKKKEQLLRQMRSTHVVGGCSQDRRPREHAVNIALLSAETTNWEVFLKSHLDIMNDRFDRVSDGSYAWERRNTYVRELEELDINLVDLLLGISLRIENPAIYHYYGNIGRLGRAISESKNKEEFEDRILAMIEDNGLDDYNRIISYYLFLNYNNYVNDKDEKKANILKLEQSISKLPDYLKDKIQG